MTGLNMFAYCMNNPVNMTDETGEAAIAAALGVVFGVVLGVAAKATAIGVEVGAAAIAAVVFAELTNRVIGTTVGIADHIIEKIKEKTKENVKEKADAIPSQRQSGGTTYYHVTTLENANEIIRTRTLKGSKWEGGYVCAWEMKPSEYAIENSGAHTGVIISFKTKASFVADTGITDPRIRLYGPVVSLFPGPILVEDVKIVGVTK